VSGLYLQMHGGLFRYRLCVPKNDETRVWCYTMLEAAGQYWQQAIEKLERQGPIKLQEEDQEMEEEKSRNAALMVQHQTRAAAVAKRNAQVCIVNLYPQTNCSH
jgi:hypothetical protein